MWGQKANTVANKTVSTSERGKRWEIPHRTEVQETEKRKLNVLQILFAAERRSDLESE